LIEREANNTLQQKKTHRPGFEVRVLPLRR